VRREFYNKPKKSKYIQQGVRKSEVADWEGAIESWMKVFDSKDKKDKKAVGKAAFNIAVAYEVLGDLEKAKEWAAKAYTEYEDNEANDYYRKLQDRIREEAILKAQLGE
jgi:tetratricopeptide (TPR) repeat protein